MEFCKAMQRAVPCLITFVRKILGDHREWSQALVVRQIPYMLFKNLRGFVGHGLTFWKASHQACCQPSKHHAAARRTLA